LALSALPRPAYADLNTVLFKQIRNRVRIGDQKIAELAYAQHPGVHCVKDPVTREW
jgi:hypothetical protein